MTLLRAIRMVREDVKAVLDRDPAARGTLEALTCYAGLHAVWGHRVAHRLWNAGYHLPARVLSQFVRFMTGVEIHPGATLGRRVVIDHGMGVVIGETAIVGDDVHMYHGVTLGGNSPRPEKRHPTVGDRVIIGANATLIGDITLGDDSRVGAGSVLTTDVEPGVTVTGIPATPYESKSTAEETDEADADDTADSVVDDASSAGETVEPVDAPADEDATDTGSDGVTPETEGVEADD